MAVALVQKTAQQIFSGVTTTSRTITGVTAGNLVVCLITAASQPNPSTPPALPTPSGWSVAENPTGPSGSSDPYRPVNAIFYKANASSGSHTADFSGAAALPTDSYGAITLFEVSGCDTSAPLDTHGTTSTLNAAGAISTPSVTNTVADAIALVICHPDSQSVSNLSFPPSSGYSDADHSTSNSSDAAYDFGYKVLSATGSQSASWTWTGTAHAQATIALFKAAAGGGGGITGAGQIASGEAIGSAAVGAGIAATGIASAEALGAPAVGAAIVAVGIASAEAVGAPVVNGAGIFAAGIASAEAFGQPAIGAGIAAAGIASGEAIGQPTVGTGTQPQQGGGGIDPGPAWHYRRGKRKKHERDWLDEPEEVAEEPAAPPAAVTQVRVAIDEAIHAARMRSLRAQEVMLIEQAKQRAAAVVQAELEEEEELAALLLLL